MSFIRNNVIGRRGFPTRPYVAGLVETGRYNSKSEVLREGVRLLQERETKLAVLDAALAKGLAQLDAGQEIPAEDVFDQLLRRYSPDAA